MEDYENILAALAAQDNLRVLRDVQAAGKHIEVEGRRYVNMSSNDYLGLAADTELQREFLRTMADSDAFLMSSSASRLMTGNLMANRELEQAIAALYPGKSAMALGSGYLVNNGILPALTQPGDMIIADKYVHASIIDGMRLAGCEWTRYNHNDLDHLESILQKKRNGFANVWVVTESLFSMDGDLAPLHELVALKHKYGLQLYLDEAHAFGVCGPRGAGYAAAQDLDTEMDVIIGTFGKALASYGAFAALGADAREVLVNRMRPLIFSTGLPPVNLLWTKFLVERMADFDNRRQKLQNFISELVPDNPTATHIIPIPAGENTAAVQMSEKFREAGFWTTPIRWPTVPKGEARVRISLTAAMDSADIDKFKATWNSIGQ